MEKIFIFTAAIMPTKKGKSMETIWQQAEQENASKIAQHMEDLFPDARVRNLGFSVVIIFQNKSVASVFPVTADAVDVFARDERETYDLKDLSFSECLEVLKKLSTLQPEQTVAGYNVPGSFTAPGQKKNRGTEQSEREGWSVLKPLNEIDRLKDPFGKDPLGAKARQKISEDQSPEIFEYLAEVLPVDSADIQGEKLTLEISLVTITVSQGENGNFSIFTQIDGETVQQSENISAGDLVKWLFSTCEEIQTRVAKYGNSNTAEDDISCNDVFETLKKLAVETGAYGGDDILKNKSLLNLNALVASPPFDRRKSPESFVGESSGSYQITESRAVPAEKMKYGHPARLFENTIASDASAPYSMMNEWALVDLGKMKGGVQLVRKNDLPRKLIWNWNPEVGCHLSPEPISKHDYKSMRKFPVR
jgi:hypothetical protein